MSTRVVDSDRKTWRLDGLAKSPRCDFAYRYSYIETHSSDNNSKTILDRCGWVGNANDAAPASDTVSRSKRQRIHHAYLGKTVAGSKRR